VQELALITLLAQAPQPMLAYDGLVSSDVPVGTGSAPLTTGPHIKLAHRSTRLVHPREGQGLGTKLLGERHLNVNVMSSTGATNNSILDAQL